MEYTHFSLESDGAARKQLDADIQKKLKVPARRSSGSESAGWTQDMAALQGSWWVWCSLCSSFLQETPKLCSLSRFAQTHSFSTKAQWPLSAKLLRRPLWNFQNILPSDSNPNNKAQLWKLKPAQIHTAQPPPGKHWDKIQASTIYVDSKL